MNDLSWLSRTSLLIGEERVRLLSQKHVLVVGMGGVGSFAAEFIARSGVGKMTIIDGDVVDSTNRNRQLPALATNVGQSKAAIMDQRLREINPELELTTIATFIEPDRVEDCLTAKPDFIIDAIDSITPKVRFLVHSYGSNIPLVSSMGAGAKLDPTQLRVADISKTYNCPFAQQIRKNLKSHGIFKGITTVFSPEEIIKESLMHTDGKNYKKSAYGTISYLPATFGAVAASVAIRKLIGVKVD
ncbi:MAG: tRNA threonylcarbamoyladenosine dehydratase [Bacteroidetes bacterium]|nr:tRNA threonylcarbamoyladenosine dehydratase [Bacteroidota bacterium]